jgi:hypothetical protein
MNFENQGATTVNSFSSNSSPLPLEKNFQAPELKGRTMGPKNFDTFRDAKRRVPNGPDPIHNRYIIYTLSIQFFLLNYILLIINY